MRVIIRTCPWNEERFRWAWELLDQLGAHTAYCDLQIVEDTTHDAFDTMLKAYALQAERGVGAWHLEDDVVATSQWHHKARAAVWGQGEHHIIQGFSRSQKDAERGSRWMPARSFYYNTCFWVPGDQAQALHDFSARWREENKDVEANVAGAYDSAIKAYLAERGERYWLVVPSLVQHRPAMSLIGGPGRTTGRQSPTFEP